MNESNQGTRLHAIQQGQAFTAGYEGCATTGTTAARMQALGSDGYMAEGLNYSASNRDMPMPDAGMPSANLSIPAQEAEPRAPGARRPVLALQNPTVTINNFPQTNYETQHPSVSANTHLTCGSTPGAFLPSQYRQMPPYQMPFSSSQMLTPPTLSLQMPTPNPQMQPLQMQFSPIPPLQTQTVNPWTQFSRMHPRPVPLGVGFDSNLNAPVLVPANAAVSSGYRPPLPIHPIQAHGWISNDVLLKNFGPRPPMTASMLFRYYSDINEYLRISNPNWQMWTTHTEDCFSNAYSLLCSFHIAYESDSPNDIWFNSWLELQIKEVADYLRSDMIQKFCCRGRGKLHMKALASVCPHETNCASHRPGLEGCSWREQWDVDMLIGSQLYRKAKSAENQLKQRVQYFRAWELEDIHAHQLQRDISLLGRIISDKPTAHLQHEAHIHRQNKKEEEINARILHAGYELMVQQAMEGLNPPLTAFNNPSSFPVSGVCQKNTLAQVETQPIDDIQPQVYQPEGWPPEIVNIPRSPMRDPPRGTRMADLEATELSLD
ncbi:hypothetical protein EV426DRAFT_577381 [Tirmania nivea]|nr:hypothetical protein EV426DRAFT_577381 [Tirmania nivea]